MILQKYINFIGMMIFFIERFYELVDENVRGGLIDIMGYSSDNAFYSFMNTMLNDPSLVVRKKKIKALNKKIAISILQRMIEDQVEEIREAVTEVLLKKEVEA